MALNADVGVTGVWESRATTIAAGRTRGDRPRGDASGSPDAPQSERTQRRCSLPRRRAQKRRSSPWWPQRKPSMRQP